MSLVTADACFILCIKCNQRKRNVVMIDFNPICHSCYNEEYKICNKCNHKRRIVDKIHQICHLCYDAKYRCHECYQSKRKKDIIIIEDRQVCHSCYNEKYEICKECNNRRRIVDKINQTCRS